MKGYIERSCSRFEEVPISEDFPEEALKEENKGKYGYLSSKGNFFFWPPEVFEIDSMYNRNYTTEELELLWEKEGLSNVEKFILRAEEKERKDIEIEKWKNAQTQKQT